MASSSTLGASSSTSNCDSYNYDVFLSFRGEDTRYNFTDHLYATLVAHGIHTFRDDEELEKGGDIASDLSRAIEESNIFVVIFSRNYADSKWCLNELVRIIDCMTQKKSTVLPVFYHVEPTDVRNQGGSFEEAFLDHAKDADQEKEKTIETWKNALNTAANRSGYHVKENQSEAKFIQKIREDIITRLNHMPLHVGENIVGMDFHLEQLKSWIKTELDEVHMVGIYGTGGIGKTTISMAIYNNISSQFDGSSFLGNIGGKHEDGLLELQKTLLQDILKCERPTFNYTSTGINEIKTKLRWKRVLIVLDDVDNYSQLEKLAGKHGWYGEKSLIIITTRNKHLLEQYEVNAIYEVQKFNHEKSSELFNWWAFKQNTPTPGFESLSNSMVKYADGLPIALKVLGGFLFKKSKAEWASELTKLENMPKKEVQSVLKVSYDKLDDTEQEIFLDIACFFRGEDKDFVARIWGSYAEIGIKVLHDCCLITISKNKLDMHDLLQQMGREIVRQQCIKEPGKRSRLWDPNDVNCVLSQNTGTEAIEGLFVEIFESYRIQFSTNSFTKLNRLRLLKVYYHRSAAWKETKVYLPMDLEFPSLELRYLHFERYPLKSLPTNFNAKNLVELNLNHSSIKQLWKKNEILHNLKVINLSYSEDLDKIPDFSSVPNLEILILKGCRAIKGLPSSIGHLKALKHLNLKSCTELVSLPESIWNLSSLETLNVVKCPKLARLDVRLCYSTSSVTCLILKGGIWWSNDRFSSLKTLNLQHGKMEGEVHNHHVFPLSSLVESCAVRIPPLSSQVESRIIKPRDMSVRFNLLELEVSSFGNSNPMARRTLSDIFHQFSWESLSIYHFSLIELSLSNCNIMDGEILNHVRHLSLKSLSLEGNHFSSIPAGMSRLSHLRGLNLSHCNKLREIPYLPSRSLRFLDVHCSDGILSSSLLSIPSLLNCFKSELIQDKEIRVGSSSFKGKGMSIVIPKNSGIVKGLTNPGMRSCEVTIELPQNWYENNDLLGFAICCVYVPVHYRPVVTTHAQFSVGYDNLSYTSEFCCREFCFYDDEWDESFSFNIDCDLFIEENYAKYEIIDKLSFRFGRCCNEHNKGSVSDQVWVIYYPKDAIKEEYRSNQWTHFMASFRGNVRVKERGFHLIYANNHVQSNFGTNHRPWLLRKYWFQCLGKS